MGSDRDQGRLTYFRHVFGRWCDPIHLISSRAVRVQIPVDLIKTPRDVEKAKGIVECAFFAPRDHSEHA